jgi:protocatechuate 3,4-dioxygenase beta subunit
MVAAMTEIEHADEGITRGGSLVKLGGFFAATLTAAAWRAAPSLAAHRSAAVSCVLTPEMTEGPYYIADEATRRDITEGKPGVPLTLRLSVVDATSCTPIKNATVDIWHADAVGVYSGFGAGASSRTFLRGVQKTDSKGLALFQTVYPGWYRGRTVHIHVKVHLGGNVVHTGQLFFPDSLTNVVYRQSPYRSRPGRDVLNAGDSIFQNGGKQSLLALRRRTGATAYLGSITMGVQRT